MQNGKILVSSPKISEGIFANSLIYIHSDTLNGSIGFMLNIQVNDKLADKWSQEINWQYPNLVFCGGPINTHLGYMLHTNDYAQESTVRLNEYLSYTTGMQIVKDINRGTGPNCYVLMVGYSQWQSGQLEAELCKGLWHASEFDLSFFFNPVTGVDAWRDAITLTAQKETDQIFNMVDIK